MYLHFDSKVLKDDLLAVLGSFGSLGVSYDRHKSLSRRLLDPKDSSPKQAKFTVIANCAGCFVQLERGVETIWSNGSPVKISLLDGTCPHCKGQKGFHFSSTKGLHA